MIEIKEAIKLLDELNIMTLNDGDSICDSEFAEAFKMAMSALKSQKIKGEWKKMPDNACVCSICGWLESWPRAIFYNFCPFCGADMRGEQL